MSDMAAALTATNMQPKPRPCRHWGKNRSQYPTSIEKHENRKKETTFADVPIRIIHRGPSFEYSLPAASRDKAMKTVLGSTASPESQAGYPAFPPGEGGESVFMMRPGGDRRRCGGPLRDRTVYPFSFL